MSESYITKRLFESKKTWISTYRGVDISMNRDDDYVITVKGKEYKFDTIEDAQDYIDEVPATIRYNKSKEVHKPEMYYIYVKGTKSNHRAMYLNKKTNKPEFKNEADADRFPVAQMRAILRNSSRYDAYKSNIK